MKKTLSDETRNLIISIISITFIIAIFVCVLCDFIINRALTWSGYVCGSCLLAWLTLLPLIKLKKHNILCSMFIFSLLVIPFLFLIEYVCPAKDWVIPLGVPVAAASLVYIWVVGFLFIKSKLRKWYVASIAFLLSVPLTLFINNTVAVFTNEPQSTFQIIMNVISSIGVALIFFYLGYARKKKTAVSK